MKKPATDVRRDNVRLLRDKWGARELARRLEYSNESYVSNITSDRSNRRLIGEKAARNIEAQLGLRDGWLDVPHTSADLSEVPHVSPTPASEGEPTPVTSQKDTGKPQFPTPDSDEILEKCAIAIAQAERDLPAPLAADKRAYAILALVESARETSVVSEVLAKRLVKLAT